MITSFGDQYIRLLLAQCTVQAIEFFSQCGDGIGDADNPTLVLTIIYLIVATPESSLGK